MPVSDENSQLRTNHRRVLDLLGRVGEASRTDLARDLGLPKATLAGIVADLVERGLVVETAPSGRRPSPGRPARVLALSGPAAAVGTLAWANGELSMAIATLTGHVLTQATIILGADLPQEAALDDALSALGETAREAGYPVSALTALVLSIPAPTRRGKVGSTPTGAAKRYEWLPAWLDQDAVGVLERRAGIPVLAENDANLAALGEHAFGAGRGKPDQVYVKISGNGVGAGLILGGRLHRGTEGFAGELAHVQVRDNGPLCTCGGRGCLIRVIGTEMIALAQPAYDQPLTFDVILALAADGDMGLQRLLADLGRTIGRPLADLCTLLNPDLFILDGSIGPAGIHIVTGMAETIGRHAHPATAVTVRVVQGGLATHADVLGAVALLRDSGISAGHDN